MLVWSLFISTHFFHYKYDSKQYTKMIKKPISIVLLIKIVLYFQI